MRVKMYIFSYSLDERKCFIYRVHEITRSYQNNYSNIIANDYHIIIIYYSLIYSNRIANDSPIIIIYQQDR